MYSRKGLAHLIDAFKFSCEGLYAMRNETPFRIELVLGVLAVPLAWFLPGMDLVWRVILTLAWLALPTMEIVNTAIEAVVDLVSPDWHPLAKKAKDCASAAVFCVGVANVIVWLAAFWDCYVRDWF
ncbi:MAG: diacylglycerol kinase [Victivallales bacterium]|nr:diacylglycerol kinase [Victivallales bacterium]